MILWVAGLIKPYLRRTSKPFPAAPYPFPVSYDISTGQETGAVLLPCTCWMPSENVHVELAAGYWRTAEGKAALCLCSLLWNTVLPSLQLPLLNEELSNLLSLFFFFFFPLFWMYLNLARRSKVTLGRAGRERQRGSKPSVVHQGKYEAEKQKGMGNKDDRWEKLDIIRLIRNLSTFHHPECNEEMLDILLVQILWLENLFSCNTTAVYIKKGKPAFQGLFKIQNCLNLGRYVIMIALINTLRYL